MTGWIIMIALGDLLRGAAWMRDYGSILRKKIWFMDVSMGVSLMHENRLLIIGDKSLSENRGPLI